MLTIPDADFRPLLNEYLEGLVESQVRSLKELIEFNIANSDRELPPDHPQQDRRLTRAEDFRMSSADYQTSLEYIKRMSKEEGIDKTLAQYNIDVIIGPADSFLSTLAAAAGKLCFFGIFGIAKWDAEQK